MLQRWVFRRCQGHRPMNKATMTEQEIRNNYIRPAIEKAGWNGAKQIREEYSLTAGRIVVRGQKASRDLSGALRADYVLEYKKNIPLAVVEAKDNKHSIEAGIQQALEYARLLGLPFAFSSIGDGFIFHDSTVDPSSGLPIEKRISLDDCPRPKSSGNATESGKTSQRTKKRPFSGTTIQRLAEKACAITRYSP